MKKTTLMLSAALAAGIVATPAMAQSNLFEQLFKKVVKPTGTTTRPALFGKPAATVQPTAEQAAATRRAATAMQTNPQIKSDVAGAATLIEKLATTGACGINDTAWNNLNRESVSPKTWDAYWPVPHVARAKDEYHDPRYCYDVLRITDYSKPAANALKFKVYYVSPQSQAAKNQAFILLRSPEGQWMVKEIYSINS